MKVMVAILALLLPVAHANVGTRIDTSVTANSSSFGGFKCFGPYPGGFFQETNLSHPFYFGVDCMVCNGQPAEILANILGGVTYSAFFIYFVFVLRKKVGFSPYIRDFSAYFFWWAFSFLGGAIARILSYIGSQYENVADVPEWVYFWGKHILGIELDGSVAGSWLLMVIFSRLLLEPCFPKIPTGYFWALLHSVLYLYLIPKDLIAHFRDGSIVFPMLPEGGIFSSYGSWACLLYGIVRRNPAAICAACLNSGMDVIGYHPNPSWQYFDDTALSHYIMILVVIFVFLAALSFFKEYSLKLHAESEIYPLDAGYIEAASEGTGRPKELTDVSNNPTDPRKPKPPVYVKQPVPKSCRGKMGSCMRRVSCGRRRPLVPLAEQIDNANEGDLSGFREVVPEDAEAVH